jgi:hypothetical protein
MRIIAPPSRSCMTLLTAGIMMCVAGRAQAQTDSSQVTTLKPTFSLGTGMFGYYGDIGFESKDHSPLVSRIGYELRASVPVTDWLEAGLFAVHGRVSANERSATRNLNFESRITTGGLQFTYTFNQLLAPHHAVEPWVSVGFEAVEFLSKTDLFDAHGNRYNYWSDGTIRDLPENAPNAADAVEISRDYSYESDIRESNLDGFGKYGLQTWAVPVGVGMKFLLPKGFDARVGVTMHFMGSDLIDGVSAQSIGARQGDPRMDRFLFTSFSVGYAINLERPEKTTRPKYRFTPTISSEQMDAEALNDDEDGDGVPDWSDRCPHTPKGITVDPSGCPFDGDSDGVPDHRDDEANSSPGAAVDARGVTIDDNALMNAWLNWKDSANATIISSRVESFGPIGKPRTTYANTPAKRSYVVEVGTQTAGISEDLTQQILSLPDVRTIERHDTTYYIVGNYDGLPDALRRELTLKGQGLTGQVMIEQEGKLLDMAQDASPSTGPDNTAARAGADDIVVRVQLGAFRHIAQDRFKGINDVVSVKGDDGLTRYYVGSFTDVNAAARRKVDMVLKGFDGAFLVAFKDGKRVSMKEAGAQLSGPEDLQEIHSDSVNTDNLTFRVQVGTFAGNVPMDKLGKYGNMGKVKPVTGESAVRYLYGEYPTRAAAELARQELQNLGFQDAFVVGELNGRIIQAEDAEKLQKGK